MNSIVLDASVALAWCFPDESSSLAESLLAQMDGLRLLVPSVWALEIANAMAMGERNQRLPSDAAAAFLEQLHRLPIEEEPMVPVQLIRAVLPLAHVHALTAYDAAYLELSLRRKLPLATLDRRLSTAAAAAGVALFGG